MTVDKRKRQRCFKIWENYALNYNAENTPLRSMFGVRYAKYVHRYMQIVKYRRINKYTGNGEWHHIIPFSLGGTDEPSNMVYVSPREHYILHLLLAAHFMERVSDATYKVDFHKMAANKMLTAICMMSNTHEQSQSALFKQINKQIKLGQNAWLNRDIKNSRVFQTLKEKRMEQTQNKEQYLQMAQFYVDNNCNQNDEKWEELQSKFNCPMSSRMVFLKRCFARNISINKIEASADVLSNVIAYFYYDVYRRPHRFEEFAKRNSISASNLNDYLTSCRDKDIDLTMFFASNVHRLSELEYLVWLGLYHMFIGTYRANSDDDFLKYIKWKFNYNLNDMVSLQKHWQGLLNSNNEHIVDKAKFLFAAIERTRQNEQLIEKLQTRFKCNTLSPINACVVTVTKLDFDIPIYNIFEDYIIQKCTSSKNDPAYKRLRKKYQQYNLPEHCNTLLIQFSQAGLNPNRRAFSDSEILQWFDENAHKYKKRHHCYQAFLSETQYSNSSYTALANMLVKRGFNEDDVRWIRQAYDDTPIKINDIDYAKDKIACWIETGANKIFLANQETIPFAVPEYIKSMQSNPITRKVLEGKTYLNCNTNDVVNHQLVNIAVVQQQYTAVKALRNLVKQQGKDEQTIINDVVQQFLNQWSCQFLNERIDKINQLPKPIHGISIQHLTFDFA